MKVKDARKHEARAEEATRGLAYRLGISKWMNIVITFDSSHSEDRTACEATCDWEYRQVSFKWNLPIVAGLTDRDLEETALHELVHPLIAPLWDCVPEADQENTKIAKLHELATENVARAIRHLIEEEK
jgi:hypothetical protein